MDTSVGAIIVFVPPILFSIVSCAFFVLWRMTVISSWLWAAGFAQTTLGFILSTFSLHPAFDAFSSGILFLGAATCYGSGLLAHFGLTSRSRSRVMLWAAYGPALAYTVFVEGNLVWQLFLTDMTFAVMLAVPVAAVARRARRPIDIALVIASGIVVADCVIRTSVFTLFIDIDSDLSTFAGSTYNLAVHLTTITILMVFPFTVLGAIISAALDQHRSEADRDPLTGLLNRRGFVKAIQGAFGTAPLSGAALVFDIDHFKRVNDEHGHAVGDQVIATMAQTLATSLGSSGIVARSGGEEFIAFLPRSSEQEGQALANLVRLAVEGQEWRAFGIVRPVTVSCGVAALAEEPMPFERAFERADRALYRAKTEGRNRVAAHVEAVRPAEASILHVRPTGRHPSSIEVRPTKVRTGSDG